MISFFRDRKAKKLIDEWDSTSHILGRKRRYINKFGDYQEVGVCSVCGNRVASDITLGFKEKPKYPERCPHCQATIEQ